MRPLLRFAMTVLSVCPLLSLSLPSLTYALALTQLIPEALNGTAIVQTDPRVMDITNAKEFIAVDYRDTQTNVTRAGIFLARTNPGTPFEHNRKTCRLVADGAVLTSVFEIGFSEGHFYYILTKGDQKLEHATQFIAHRVSGNKFIVDSQYLGEQYAPQPDAFDTINVQIWASDPLDTISLASEMVEKLKSMGTVLLHNTQPLTLPTVLINRASHFNGVMTFSVINMLDQPEKVVFEGTLVKELGSKPSSFSFSRMVISGESIVTFDVGPMSSIVAYSVDSAGFRDQIFLGRGFGYFSDRDSGGITKVTFDNQSCASPSSDIPQDAFLVIPGCSDIRGTVDKWVGIYLPTGSFVGESFNLREKGFIGVQFWARSITPFRLQVEDITIQDFDFHGANLVGDGTWRQYTILFDSLTQRGFGKTLPFTGQVDQLSWLVDPPDGQNLPFDLGVDKVILLRTAGTTVTPIPTSTQPSPSPTPTPASGGGGSGGGCTMNPGTGFDPTLVGTIGLILAYLGWTRIRRRPSDDMIK